MNSTRQDIPSKAAHFNEQHARLLKLLNQEQFQSQLADLKDFQYLMQPTANFLRTGKFELGNLQITEAERNRLSEQYNDLLDNRSADIALALDGIEMAIAYLEGNPPDKEKQEEMIQKLSLQIDHYKESSNFSNFIKFPNNFDAFKTLLDLEREAATQRNRNSGGEDLILAPIIFIAIVGTIGLMLTFPVAAIIGACAIGLALAATAGYFGWKHFIKPEDPQKRVNSKPYTDQVATLFSKTKTKLQEKATERLTEESSEKQAPRLTPLAS